MSTEVRASGFRRPMMGIALGTSIGIIAGTTLGSLAAGLVPDSGKPPTVSRPLREDAISNVVALRSPSVVFIHTVERAWLGEEGVGSGVIIDNGGLIVTNAHVIDTAAAIHVRAQDGSDTEAVVVGSDRDIDLALLRPTTPLNLPAAPLGDSDRLRVGEIVVAIGNPLGLHHTVTSGIISAKGRAIGHTMPVLQTDAAVNPGSSGGGLFDLRGQLVGITSGILSERGQNVGLNIAIPISAVRAALPRLRGGPQNGAVQ